jgi:hypothetical protein
MHNSTPICYFRPYAPNEPVLSEAFKCKEDVMSFFLNQMDRLPLPIFNGLDQVRGFSEYTRPSVTWDRPVSRTISSVMDSRGCIALIPGCSTTA